MAGPLSASAAAKDGSPVRGGGENEAPRVPPPSPARGGRGFLSALAVTLSAPAGAEDGSPVRQGGGNEAPRVPPQAPHGAAKGFYRPAKGRFSGAAANRRQRVIGIGSLAWHAAPARIIIITRRGRCWRNVRTARPPRPRQESCTARYKTSRSRCEWVSVRHAIQQQTATTTATTSTRETTTANDSVDEPPGQDRP